MERQYIHVSYLASWGYTGQDFKLSETRLINAILKEQAIDGKCQVFLRTCSEKAYKSLFG